LKSSNKSEGFLKNYIKIVLKPDETIKKINEQKHDLLESLIIVMLSAFILLLGIFIVGGTIYNVFYEQYSTFILEQLTSGTLFGFSMSRYDFVFVFLSAFIFIIKSWLFFSIMFYLFMRIFGETENIKDTMIRFSWTIYPYAWIIFIFSMISLLFKLILPFVFHYIFFIGLGVIFIVFIPITLQRFYDNSERESVSSYMVYGSYYLTLFVIILLWTYNHYNITQMVFF